MVVGTQIVVPHRALPSRIDGDERGVDDRALRGPRSGTDALPHGRLAQGPSHVRIAEAVMAARGYLEWQGLPVPGACPKNRLHAKM